MFKYIKYIKYFFIYFISFQMFSHFVIAWLSFFTWDIIWSWGLTKDLLSFIIPISMVLSFLLVKGERNYNEKCDEEFG